MTMPAAPSPEASKHTKIIEALLALAVHQPWEDITMTDIALKAGLTLGEFRDCFPSKGAVLGGFSKMIDRKVLGNVNADMLGEPARERLFDILMRRLEALAPYREGLREISKWAHRDPVAALALNSSALNSMRFMLEAANIESEGAVGAVKLQGLVLAWRRIVSIWLDDETPDQEETRDALGRELDRGGRIVAFAEDMNRLAAPLRTFAGALFTSGRNAGERVRGRMARSSRAASSYRDRDTSAHSASRAEHGEPDDNGPPLRH